MNIFERIGVAIHRFTGNIEGQRDDLKKMMGEAATAPRGSAEEANAFCTVEDQSQYISTGKGMNISEYGSCLRSMRQFQDAATVWNKSITK